MKHSLILQDLSLGLIRNHLNDDYDNLNTYRHQGCRHCRHHHHRHRKYHRHQRHRPRHCHRHLPPNEKKYMAITLL